MITNIKLINNQKQLYKIYHLKLKKVMMNNRLTFSNKNRDLIQVICRMKLIKLIKKVIHHKKKQG